MPTDPNALKLIWVFTAILLPVIPALLLYKLLPSTADVSGPFRGMQVKLGGAFAGYFLLVMVIYFWPGNKISDLRYEVWTVKGQVVDEDGTALPGERVSLNIQPRGVEYYQDGAFEMYIVVTRGQSGEAKFPKLLLVERQPPQAFGNAWIHLDSAAKPVDTSTKKELEVNNDRHEITVKDPIKLKKIQDVKDYIPPTAPLQPTAIALPESTPQ